MAAGDRVFADLVVGRCVRARPAVSYPSPVTTGGPRAGEADWSGWLTARPGPAAPIDVVLARPAPRFGGGRRVASVAVVALAVLGLVYAVAAPVLSRRDYGTFAFWNVPKRVDYCGHRYVAGGVTTGTATQIWISYHDASDQWTLTSRTFTGRPIYAVEIFRVDDTAVCAADLYVPLSSDRWQIYPLSTAA